MKMNVRNARRLDQEIATVVQSLIGQITPNVALSVFSAPINEDTIKNATAKVMGRVSDANLLSDFRFQLREAIAAANQAEVNKLTNQLAAKEKYVEIISRLTVQVTPDPYSHRRSRETVTPYQPAAKLDVQAINAQLNALVEATKSGAATGTSTLELSVLTADVFTKIKQDIGRAKREINNLKDRISAANLTAKVELEVPVVVQETLLRYGLTAE